MGDFSVKMSIANFKLHLMLNFAEITCIYPSTIGALSISFPIFNDPPAPMVMHAGLDLGDAGIVNLNVTSARSPNFDDLVCKFLYSKLIHSAFTIWF